MMPKPLGEKKNQKAKPKHIQNKAKLIVPNY